MFALSENLTQPFCVASRRSITESHHGLKLLREKTLYECHVVGRASSTHAILRGRSVQSRQVSKHVNSARMVALNTHRMQSAQTS